MSGRAGDLAWIVVNTHAHKERLALDNIARQSFAAYCPMLPVTIRHARTMRRTLRPMFPGYVFAGIADGACRWRPLLSTRGVRSIVLNGERPSRLPGAFIEALKAREVDGAIVRPSEPFRIGQAVRLVRQPFAGLLATIIEMDERQRLVVLLDLLNRPVRVRVEAEAVTDIPA